MIAGKIITIPYADGSFTYLGECDAAGETVTASDCISQQMPEQPAGYTRETESWVSSAVADSPPGARIETWRSSCNCVVTDRRVATT